MTGFVDAAGVELTRMPQAPVFAYAGLPSNPQSGMIVVVTDANTNTWGASVGSGGGSDVVLVWYNGANWTVVGK